jgi:hypothetical protein
MIKKGIVDPMIFKLKLIIPTKNINPSKTPMDTIPK